MNKLLVRSCFEGSGWIDRIAADPVGEHKIKINNEKINVKQRSKIGFAGDAQRNNLSISFGPSSRPVKVNKSSAKRAHKDDGRQQPGYTLPQQSSGPESHGPVMFQPSLEPQGFDHRQLPSHVNNMPGSLPHHQTDVNGRYHAAEPHCQQWRPTPAQQTAYQQRQRHPVQPQPGPPQPGPLQPGHPQPGQGQQGQVQQGQIQ